MDLKEQTQYDIFNRNSADDFSPRTAINKNNRSLYPNVYNF